MVKLMVALMVLMGALFATQVSSAYAHPALAGKSYGCKINPNAKICQTPVKAATAGGAVASVSTSPVAALPATGGALPSTTSLDLELLLTALVCLVAGAGTLKLATYRQ